MQPIGRILKSNLKQTGLSSRIQSALIIEFFAELLKKEFGAKQVEKIKSMSLRQGKLNVNVESAPFKHEINLRESLFLKSLEKEFGPGVVKSLTFFG